MPRLNDYGFMESPYPRVKDSRVIDCVTIVNAGDSEYRVAITLNGRKLIRLHS